jgi:hypothetical protein
MVLRLIRGEFAELLSCELGLLIVKRKQWCRRGALHQSEACEDPPSAGLRENWCALHLL